MLYKPQLRFPGTILHLKRGRIDLCKLTQKQLKELYDEGCSYIQLVDGDPPVEDEISAKVTPQRKTDKPKPDKRSAPKRNPQ